MSASDFVGKAIGFFIIFFVLFILPAALPLGAFLLLAPVGFFQLFLFTILAIILYIIALIILWFLIYCLF